LSHPLAAYRQTQARLRDLFASFTAEHCPTCPHPCCRKPVRVGPVDVMLAEAHGMEMPEGADPASERVELGTRYLSEEVPEGCGGDVPCDFLGPRGCTFPRDLMPYECTRYICPIMERELPPGQLRIAKRLVRRLDDDYRKLKDALRPRR
jgi:hypothetical protein